MGLLVWEFQYYFRPLHRKRAKKGGGRRKGLTVYQQILLTTFSNVKHFTYILDSHVSDRLDMTFQSFGRLGHQIDLIYI